MKKSQIQLAWKKVINETHKRPKFGEVLKNKNISKLGNLLLFTQVLLNKIEQEENAAFNTIIYQKTINFYCSKMKKYV